MNPCEYENQLTAWILGELPETEATALKAHLQSCAPCRTAAAELRKTVALLEDGLATPEKNLAAVPTLDGARRAMLLEIKPEMQPLKTQTHWFFRIHPAFKAAAALVAVLSIVILGAMSTLKLTKSAVMPMSMMVDDNEAVLGEIDGVASDMPAEASSWYARHGGNGILGSRSANLPQSGQKARSHSVDFVESEIRREKPSLEKAVRENSRRDYGLDAAAAQPSKPVGQTAAAQIKGKEHNRDGQSVFSESNGRRELQEGEKGKKVENTVTRSRDGGSGGMAPAKTPAPSLPAVTTAPAPPAEVAPRALKEALSDRQSTLSLQGSSGKDSLSSLSKALPAQKSEKPDALGLGDADGDQLKRKLVAGEKSAKLYFFDSGAVNAEGQASDGIQVGRDVWGETVTSRRSGEVDKTDPDRLVSSQKPMTPGEKMAVDKLKRIVIPEVRFRPPATIIDAVDFFKQASRDYDDHETSVEQRGVNLVLKLPEAGRPKEDALVSADPFAEDAVAKYEVPVVPAMSARFISLYDAMQLVCDVTGYQMKVSEDGPVILTPIGDPCELTAEELKSMDEARKPAQPLEPLPFNPFVTTAENNFSTFAIDVDTASYTLTRQAIVSGSVPAPEKVRTEEIVNAFDYGDQAPEATVFRVYQDGAQSPFGPGLNLLRIGVKGRRLGREEQRPAMLTFVIDTSGSMAQPDRIGLARLALGLLMDQLAEQDRIQLIAYSDHATLILEPVSVSEKERVLAAFKRLQCNGSTNLEEGLQLAYAQAVQSFVPGAENRVILISDGVANLGADSAQEILDKVAANRRQGITCSVFGVGRGTYNDRMLEELANKGDGVYKFLDSEEEVKRAFVDDLAATLNTIAKDAKIQVEWNPKVVRRYRQLGYENRALTKEQFRDDTVDAGEVGSGQSVTALYELELAPDVSPDSRLGTVRIRYQRTDTGKIEEIEAALSAAAVLRPAHQASPSFKVAASAAEFAEQLRGSPYAAGTELQAVADYLRPAVLELPLDTRVKELLDLITAMEAMQ